MNEIASAAIQSVAEHPIKSASNAAFTGGVATATAMDSIVGWIPTIGIVIGIVAQLFFIYCAYIKLKKDKLYISENGRRESDKRKP